MDITKHSPRYTQKYFNVVGKQRRNEKIRRQLYRQVRNRVVQPADKDYGELEQTILQPDFPEEHFDRKKEGFLRSLTKRTKLLQPLKKTRDQNTLWKQERQIRLAASG